MSEAAQAQGRDGKKGDKLDPISALWLRMKTSVMYVREDLNKSTEKKHKQSGNDECKQTFVYRAYEAQWQHR